MRKKFVKTSNVTKFLLAFQALQKRGAEEACLMVVDGLPGLGKTDTIQWWATNNDCAYVRAKKEWTPNWMLSEILQSLGIADHQHSFQKRYTQTLEALGERARDADRNGRPFAVIVDEVDHISKSTKMLETLRDLSDMLEIPFILVGMGRVRGNLQKLPQVFSRIGQTVEFSTLNFEDTQRLVQELCEVDVADDMVAFLHKVSNGLVRELKNGLSAIELFGKTNDGLVTLEKMNGQPLLNDRKTGRSILVRA